MKIQFHLALALWCVNCALAQTNQALAVVAPNIAAATNQIATSAARSEQIRNECIAGRRTICGRVIKILPAALIVDSGYTTLLQAPYNQSWLVSGGAMVSRDPKVLELNEPATACVGPVCLVDYPKRPPVNLYDYVVLQGYPVGQHTYTSVPGVQKTVRQFAAGLDTAIRLRLEAGEK